MRYALNQGDFEYIWLLNNDTVIKSDALAQMVERMQQAKPEAGICGSMLLYYHEPGVVQALGGATFNRWIAGTKLIGQFQTVIQTIHVTQTEHEMSCVAGASMLVSKQFIQTVGLMSEEYFLYFEEIDWILKAKGKYNLAFAPNSVVYHKEGRSIGSHSRPKEKSLMSDYYWIKNRLVFTYKFYPYALPTVYLGILISLINRIRRKQWTRVVMIGKILLSSWKMYY